MLKVSVTLIPILFCPPCNATRLKLRFVDVKPVGDCNLAEVAKGWITEVVE